MSKMSDIDITFKTVIEKIQHRTRYRYLMGDEDSMELQDLMNDMRAEIEFLREVKRIVVELLHEDRMRGNNSVLKIILAKRTLRTMLELEGDSDEQAQANLLHDH